MVVTEIPEWGAGEEIPEWSQGNGFGRAFNNSNIIIPEGYAEEEEMSGRGATGTDAPLTNSNVIIPEGGAEEEEIPEWARGDGYGRALNNSNIIIRRVNLETRLGT